jgi:iron uptake system component EfeO
MTVSQLDGARCAIGATARSGLVGATVVAVLAGCSGGTTGGPVADRTVVVTATDDACGLSPTSTTSGVLTFAVTNRGSDVTEFYLRDADGRTVLAEVENVGPGTTRELVVSVPPGGYLASCVPGMSGDGFRASLTVTVDARSTTVDPDAARSRTAAHVAYLGYVREQTSRLLATTRDFVTAYRSGDTARARDLYPVARTFWERVEPVAEAFGDLDPRMDLREADVTEGGDWTGWHRLEKDLWPPAPAADGGPAAVPLTTQQRDRYTDLLLTDTQDLVDRTHAETFTVTVDQIGNGAAALLEEIATGKVTGEEEVWSHTDLWDVQANLDGARAAYGTLRDATVARDPDLAGAVDARFADVQTVLDSHRTATGFVPYTDLTADQVRDLARAADALGEPLSHLTAAVLASR